jgi:adenylate cyclase
MTNLPRSPRTLLYATIISLFLTTAIFSLERTIPLHSLDLSLYDLLSAYDLQVAAQRAEPPSDQVINIDFDESTVRDYNAFPLPRLLLAQVITKIAATKPSVIGIDVILDIARKPDEDAQLAKVIDDAGNVILISEYGFDTHLRNDPLRIFQEAAAGVAFGDLPIDDDGAIRRMFLRVTTDSYKALSLPVALADLASGQHLRPGGPGYLVFGPHKIPLATTQPDTTLIHFHPYTPTQIISVEKLLAQDFNPPSFANKIVLIGQSSEMGKDLFPTPVSRADVSIAPGRDILSGA